MAILGSPPSPSPSARRESCSAQPILLECSTDSYPYGSSRAQSSSGPRPSSHFNQPPSRADPDAHAHAHAAADAMKISPMGPSPARRSDPPPVLSSSTSTDPVPGPQSPALLPRRSSCPPSSPTLLSTLAPAAHPPIPISISTALPFPPAISPSATICSTSESANPATVGASSASVRACASVSTADADADPHPHPHPHHRPRADLIGTGIGTRCHQAAPPASPRVLTLSQLNQQSISPSTPPSSPPACSPRLTRSPSPSPSGLSSPILAASRALLNKPILPIRSSTPPSAAPTSAHSITPTAPLPESFPRPHPDDPKFTRPPASSPSPARLPRILISSSLRPSTALTEPIPPLHPSLQRPASLAPAPLIRPPDNRRRSFVAPKLRLLHRFSLSRCRSPFSASSGTPTTTPPSTPSLCHSPADSLGPNVAPAIPSHLISHRHTMHYSSLPPSMTTLNLSQNENLQTHPNNNHSSDQDAHHHHQIKQQRASSIALGSITTNSSSSALATTNITNTAATKTGSAITTDNHHSAANRNSVHSNNNNHRHSFWAGLGLKDRSISSKSSTVTLNTTFRHASTHPPNQKTDPAIDNRPSLSGPTRVVAMVGNVRHGLGRMILEELVGQKFIVVALVEKADGDFSRSVELLAKSPSLFHAFVVEGGLFGPAMVDGPQEVPRPDDARVKGSQRGMRTFRLTSRRTLVKPSPASSAPTAALPSSPSVAAAARRRTIAELKNIFQAYRVDTVICSFEPQLAEPPRGPRAQTRVADEIQLGLPPPVERARIERMERTVLEASLAAGSVTRFAVGVHPTGLGPSVLTPPPCERPRAHLLAALPLDEPAPISLTEFRWGFLMNELACDEGLVDGATAENGLGKWLCEPPSSRWVVDFEHRRCVVPGARGEPRKGKQKVEPVCFTLAEDVARFIGLACKLRGQWEWKTGKMVGDCLKGGWEEMVEIVEEISGKRFEREHVCVVGLVNESSGSDSGSSKGSLDQQRPPSSLDLVGLGELSGRARGLDEEAFKFEDALRACIAREGLDASSVLLREFARVWFAPLPQPPMITVDGNRVRKSTTARPARARRSQDVREDDQREWIIKGAAEEEGRRGAGPKKPDGVAWLAPPRAAALAPATPCAAGPWKHELNRSAPAGMRSLESGTTVEMGSQSSAGFMGRKVASEEGRGAADGSRQTSMMVGAGSEGGPGGTNGLSVVRPERLAQSWSGVQVEPDYVGPRASGMTGRVGGPRPLPMPPSSSSVASSISSMALSARTGMTTRSSSSVGSSVGGGPSQIVVGGGGGGSGPGATRVVVGNGSSGRNHLTGTGNGGSAGGGSENRESNRILRGSPLATRVA